MRNPRVRGGVAFLVVALAAMALVASASAKSVENNYFSHSVGEGEFSLEERSGVVVDVATGDLYVSDTGHDRIARYGAAGEPLGSLATLDGPTFLALDESSGDFYAVDEGNESITKLDSSGAVVVGWGTAGHVSGFGEIAGIAVDQSGNLFVAGMDHTLHELTSTGAQTSQCELPGRVAGPGVESELYPRGISVDSADDIYFSLHFQVNNFSGKELVKSTSACQRLNERLGDGGVSSAVDRSDQSVFSVSTGEAGAPPGAGGIVEHLSAAGSRIATFGGTMEKVQISGQLAVQSSDQTVYLANLGADDISVFAFGKIEPPKVEILPPTNVKGTSAELHAVINPEAPAGNLPAWEVHYVFACLNVSTGETECKGPNTEGFIESGSTAEEVTVTVTGLQPASAYEVYVTAANLAGAGARSPEEPEVGIPFQTAAAPPTIEEEGIVGSTETSLVVAAQVDPRGAETGYGVEYVTRSQFEASGFAGAQKTALQYLPSGIKPQPVSVTVGGLSSMSSYVLRLVASNTVEGTLETVYGEVLNSTIPGPLAPILAGTCPANESLRTGAGASLPDCRAYELASPVDKGGGSVEALPGSIQAPGGSGNAITFFSQAGIPGGVGAQDYPTFLASRTGGSWSTTGLLPPQELGEIAAYLGMTPDGRYSVTEARRRGIGSGLFLGDLQSGGVVTVVPTNAGCSEACFFFAGASEDDSRIFFETELELDKNPPTTSGPMNVYMWNAGTGQVSLVSLDQNGGRLPEGAFAGPFSWPNDNLGRGGAGGNQYVAAVNAVSADGEDFVFTARGAAGHGQLYDRIGLGGGSPHSVKVSAYETGRGPTPELPAAFLEATPGGRYVFFKSKAELTKDSYSGEGEGTESLYRYDTVSGKLIDVTTEAKTQFKKGPGVVGMLGTSRSGNIAYFVSTTKLTTKAGPGGAVAQEGQANLFRWEEGASTPITFIASLKDGPLYGGSREATAGDARDWSSSIVEPHNEGDYTAKTARVSVDGGVVVFASHNSLTGVPNLARACDPEGDGRLSPCSEFFRYSAASGTLDCVSCDPTGERPLNSASMTTGYINAADLTNGLAAPTIPRNLSASGDRFFFQTPDSLLPDDRNGPACSAATANEQEESCLDVYEWEAPGTPGGSCQSAEIGGGCLYLISSGEGEEPSYFGDADPEGNNAFILTASQLVPVDRDELYDVYDASVNGGLVSQHETPTPPCGSRAACQGRTISPSAEGQTPGSVTLVAPGNPTQPTSCKKGFVRKGGKCVKKSAPHKKKHKKKSKKGKKKSNKGKKKSNKGKKKSNKGKKKSKKRSRDGGDKK